MTETLENGYSSDRSQQELSNEHQNGRAYKLFDMFCILVPLMKVASGLQGLKSSPYRYLHSFCGVLGQCCPLARSENTSTVC